MVGFHGQILKEKTRGLSLKLSEKDLIQNVKLSCPVAMIGKETSGRCCDKAEEAGRSS